MSEFLACWSSLLDGLQAGSLYVTAAAPLVAQVTDVAHISTDLHCIAVLVGWLHFLIVPYAFCAPPPAFRTPLLLLAADLNIMHECHTTPHAASCRL